MNTVCSVSGLSVLIFGASRGIGAAAARLFAEQGARVVLAADDLDGLKQQQELLSDIGEVRIVRADVAVAADIEHAVAEAMAAFGRLDAAVNNAAISQPKTVLDELAIETFDRVMSVNMRGVFLAMQAEVRAMRAGGGGSIVNTGSIASSVGMPGMAAYVTSKHAVAGLTKAAALDYAKSNIRVNMVAPGAIDTAMVRAGLGATAEGRARLEAVTPLGRIAAPMEVAQAMLWLCSPAASFITGASLAVDGGYTIL